MAVKQVKNRPLYEIVPHTYCFKYGIFLKKSYQNGREIVRPKI